MSYTPTEWVTGDIITAEKLNKIENGIASVGGMLIVTVSEKPDSETIMILDKTWQQIHDAVLSTGAMAIYREIQDNRTYILSFISVYYDSENYGVAVSGYVFTASSPNDYPESSGVS